MLCFLVVRLVEERDTENVPLVPRVKKDKNTGKKVIKELQFCK